MNTLEASGRQPSITDIIREVVVEVTRCDPNDVDFTAPIGLVWGDGLFEVTTIFATLESRFEKYGLKIDIDALDYKSITGQEVADLIAQKINQVA